MKTLESAETFTSSGAGPGGHDRQASSSGSTGDASRGCMRRAAVQQADIVQTELNRLAAAAANLYLLMTAVGGAEQQCAVVQAARSVLAQSICFQGRYVLGEK